MCLPCPNHPPSVPGDSAAQTPVWSPWLPRAFLWKSPLQCPCPPCLLTLLPIERHIPRAQDSPQDRVCVGGQHTPGLCCEPVDLIGPSFSGSVASDLFCLRVVTRSWAPARCVSHTCRKCLGLHSSCISCRGPWVPPHDSCPSSPKQVAPGLRRWPSLPTQTQGRAQL